MNVLNADKSLFCFLNHKTSNLMKLKLYTDCTQHHPRSQRYNIFRSKLDGINHRAYDSTVSIYLKHWAVLRISVCSLLAKLCSTHFDHIQYM